MLLVLEESVAKALNQDTVLDALEKIALGRREGKHLIFAKRRTLKSLIECPALSKRARQVYSKVYENLPQMQGYLQTFIRRVEVIANDIGFSYRYR